MGGNGDHNIVNASGLASSVHDETLFVAILFLHLIFFLVLVG